MPTPASLDAWLANGHDDDSLLVHHDVYFAGEDDRNPVQALLDAALETLPDDERDAVTAVVLAGMSYRDAAVDLEVRLSSGEPDKKAVHRRVERGLARLKTHMHRRAPWFAAFLSDPSVLDELGPYQAELL